MVAVLALGRRASMEMTQQLQQFFSPDSVAVEAHCLDDLRRLPQTPVKSDLAIVSCEPAMSLLGDFLPDSTPVIIAQRTLSAKAVGQLMELPMGTKTLLVTKNSISIAEFMQTIHHAGISHISIHSFLTHDFATCAAIKTVLLADEPEQIPPWTTRAIDLGVREFELSSLIEIARQLNQHIDISASAGSRYLQEIVSRREHFLQTIQSVDHLNQQLNAVVNNVRDCLIVMDADFVVRLLNNVTLELIGLESAQVLGKSLFEILPALAKTIRSNHSIQPGENLVGIGLKTFHVSLQTQRDMTGQVVNSLISLRDVTEVISLEKEVRHALKSRGHVAKYTFDDIVGQSAVLCETITNARRLADSDLNIFIWGESGVGKELFAHAIHNASPRMAKSFVAANCAAFPPTLLESELFGYEDGAFTGARRGGKPGLMEQADGGTLFLDEVGDLPLEAQARLLRALQEREIMRVGSSRIIAIDIRIIAATNKNLIELVAKGQFRQDLFYRLSVAPLHIPPLKNRPEDIPLLLRHFMQQCRVAEQFMDQGLAEQLSRYEWPGNIRELHSLVQYAAVIGTDKSSFCRAALDRLQFFRPAIPILPINLDPTEITLYRDILTLFAEAKSRNVCLGRGHLLKQLACRNSLPLNEQVLRNKMDKLKAAGFLGSRQGRQGTYITTDGEFFLATQGAAAGGRFQ